MLHAMIMAGGGGTRFWPRSRQKRPKQFLTLVGDRSLLQQAFDRIEAQVPAGRCWIISAAVHRAEVTRQLPELSSDRIIGEPCGRDTAACIGLGAALIARQDPDAIMMVMPADHVIEPAQEFRRALSLNPNSDGAHRRLARVYVHVGFFEEALQHAAIALAINPSNAQALNSRAQALLWMGKDEEALATFLSIPGPVLPELVEANTVFTLLRLGRREEASLQLKTALRKYPNDKGGNLAGIEAMLLAESEPVKAAAFIETVARRKAVNPAHHAAYFAACASARMRRAKEAVDWLREAAETGFPCYALFARDANLDPIRADPIFQGFMADLQKRSAFLRKAMFPDRK